MNDKLQSEKRELLKRIRQLNSELGTLNSIKDSVLRRINEIDKTLSEESPFYYEGAVHTYAIKNNNEVIRIKAESIPHALEQFQEKFGYWPSIQDIKLVRL